MKRTKCLTLLLLVFGVLQFCEVAQPAVPLLDDDTRYGKIRGNVTDAETSLPLSDVNIKVMGMRTGTASSRAGAYDISFIPAGQYTLEISRIGYYVSRVAVRVEADRITVRDLQLHSKIIEFDEVVMTAARKEQTVNMAPASVSIVQASDIEQRNIATFDQALEHVPGLSIRRSTGISVQALSLRGSSDVAGGGVGNRVLLTIDGRPALSSDSGGALWSLVPTNFIDRVEIVKGAYSSLYGSTAMGGVINVITKKPASSPHFKVRAESGFYETPPKSIRHRDTPSFFNMVDFSHHNRLGKMSYLLSLGRKTSAGHRERSAYEFYNVYGKLIFDLSNARTLEVTTGGDVGRNDYPHTWFSNLEPLKVAPKFTDNVQRKTTFSTDVYYYAIPSSKVRYSSRFYFYRQMFKSEFNPNDAQQAIPQNEPFGLSTRSESMKFGSLTQFDLNLGERNFLIGGLDIQRDLVDSTPDTILYGKRQINSLGIYAQDEHEVLQNVTLNLGLRLDVNKLEGGRTLTQASPKAALVYSPVEAWTLRFLVGRGFRAPTIAERFFQREIAGGTRFKPNPDLEAENVTSFEIGNRLRLNNTVELDAALFSSTYHDMIYWIDVTAEEDVDHFLFQVRNLNKARMTGVELSLSLSPWRYLSANFNYTYVDAKDLSHNRRTGFLAYKVRHTFNFRMLARTGSWCANFDGRYNSRVEEVFLYPNDKPDAFFVLNAKVTRKFGKNLSVSVGGNNLLNAQYEELARFRMPGRSWMLGVSLEH